MGCGCEGLLAISSPAHQRLPVEPSTLYPLWLAGENANPLSRWEETPAETEKFPQWAEPGGLSSY